MIIGRVLIVNIFNNHKHKGRYLFASRAITSGDYERATFLISDNSKIASICEVEINKVDDIITYIFDVSLVDKNINLKDLISKELEVI